MTDREARKGFRRKVDAPATLIVGEDVYYGTVLDLGSGGAFFRPERAVVGGEYSDIDEPPHVLGVRDEVTLAFERTGRTRRAEGKVVWVGCSDLHFAQGIGLQLEDGLSVAL